MCNVYAMKQTNKTLTYQNVNTHDKVHIETTHYIRLRDTNESSHGLRLKRNPCERSSFCKIQKDKTKYNNIRYLQIKFYHLYKTLFPKTRKAREYTLVFETTTITHQMCGYARSTVHSKPKYNIKNSKYLT